MSGRQVAGLITFIVASGTLGLYSTSLHFKMIDQVNTKLPTEQQFSALGWHYFKLRRLLVEYRRLYPSGTLDKRLCFLGGIGVSMVVVMAWQLGFPRLGILWLGIAGGFALWLAFRR
jgi:hypothetical protein